MKKVLTLFSKKGFFNYSKCSPSRLASTYKAAVLEKLERPLKLDDLKEKKLGSGQVRIQVHACSINCSDYVLAQGANPTKYPIPVVPGYEISGQVLETNQCQEIAKGDKVVALSKATLGGFAEQCIVDEKDVWILPSTLDYTGAVALVDSFGTALLGLVRRGHLSEKQTVMVTMAPAHGYAPVDLAANVYKAKVIAVCMSEEDTPALRERGAWCALSYNEKRMLASVKELTNDKGVSTIYDTLAGDVLTTCMKCIKHEGDIVVAGYTLQELPRVRITDLLSLPSFNLSGVSLLSYRKHDFGTYRQVISDVLEMSEQGLITPTISATYSLEQVNEALETMKNKQALGKSVLKIIS